MNMKLKCIITDDEPMARKGLKGYLEKVDFLELVAVCEDAVQLNQLLKQQHADLLFLDINMPLLNGIEFMKMNPTAPKVIFTTAYEAHALEGYELDILDYLLKPISFDRFLKAANKAYDYFRLKQSNEAGYLFVKTDARLEKLIFSEILFVEALENYLAIQLPDRKLIIRSTLKTMMESLPASQFAQTHKSYLVNLNAVRSVEGNLLQLGKFNVPMARQQKEQVLERILKNKLH
jgi:DNA-binding LytR/AlgR family response regulator